MNQRTTWNLSSTWRASGRYCAMVWVVWAGPVGDDCLHLAAPPGSLITEEPGQRRFRATRDHRQHLAAITGGDHGHIPMPAPNRRFVDQQQTARPGPATLRHPLRVGSHQPHYPMPSHPMMTAHRPNRHHPHVSNQPIGEPARQTALELVMVLKVALPAVPTFEPAATPHQRCAAAVQLKITNPLRSLVLYLLAVEPAMAAPRPLPGRFHLHLKTLNRIDQHSRHANTPRAGATESTSTPVTRTPDRCSRTDITSDIDASP